MGNCYSAGQEDIETSLSQNKILRNNKAQAGFQAEDDTTPDLGQDNQNQGVDLEAQEQAIAEDTESRLENFLQSVPSTHPNFTHQSLIEIVTQQAFDGFRVSQLARPSNITLSSLSYKEATILADGSLYEGTYNEGTDKPEGLGYKIQSDGTLLQGVWVDGKLQGKGRLISSTEREVYNGEFRDSLRHGQGESILVDENTKYVGQWANDLRHGRGVETWSDGAVYQGDYVEGKKAGSGSFKWADGSTYGGQFADNMIQGYGEYKWADGRVYTGEWFMNKMHGKGLFVWEDGRKYEGEYQDDKKHGQGRFTWPDGRIYDGAWADGRQHGIGNYTSADGRVRQGEWSDGKRIKWVDQT